MLQTKQYNFSLDLPYSAVKW